MIKRVSGHGIWTDYKDTKTGRHSLTENIVPKLVAKWCKPENHEYYITNMSKREMKCKICKHESNFVVGRDRILEDRVYLG